MKDLLPFVPCGKLECPKCLNGYMELKLYGTDEEEYIEVTCGGCGNTWNMETADAEKNREIMEVKKKVAETPESLKLLRDTQAETEKKAIEEGAPEKPSEEKEEGMKAKEDDETREAPVKEE